MTAFANGQLLGDEALYGHERLEHISGKPPLGLAGNLRLGVALEAARAWASPTHRSGATAGGSHWRCAWAANRLWAHACGHRAG